MDRVPRLQPSSWYLGLLCVLGPIASLCLALAIEFGHVKLAFEDVATQTFREIEARADRFELALEGFANFIAIVDDPEDAQIRAYTQGLRQLYPEIYMFEIATLVRHSERDSFEQSMRDRGLSNFSIHGFDYDDTRQLKAVEESPFYYPIRFIEPESPETQSLLGLDLVSTSSILVTAINKSLAAPRAIASDPFELLEGGMGYVIYRPVRNPVSEINIQDEASVLNIAMLAIRVMDLLPHWLQAQDRYHVTLFCHHSPEAKPVVTGNAFSDMAPDWLQKLRTLKYTAVINNISQPFELTIKKVVHWSDLSLVWLMLVFFCGTFLCFYAARSISLYLLRKSRAREEQQQLYRKANFDALTELPNINLLLDRAEQALRMADRSEGKVGICYLDINKFKQINDSKGHQVGDRALIEIAARLKRALRSEDTAARIHGDEFVILLPELENIQALRQVSAKILAIFDQPFAISEPVLRIGGSVGIAMYPDDADDLESLLHISDERMYVHKQDASDPTADLFSADSAEWVLTTGPERAS